jgi:hypothetical protein
MLWSAVRCLSWDNASQASGCGGPRRVGTERRSGAAPTRLFRDATKSIISFTGRTRQPKGRFPRAGNLQEARNLLGAALANVLG